MAVKESGFSLEQNSSGTSAGSGSGRNHHQYNQENLSNHQDHGRQLLYNNKGNDGSRTEEDSDYDGTCNNVKTSQRKLNGSYSASNRNTRTLEMNSNKKTVVGLADLVGEVEQGNGNGGGGEGGPSGNCRNRSHKPELRRKHGICDVIEAQLEHLGKG